MPDGFTSLLPNGLFSVKKEEHRVARRMLVPVRDARLHCLCNNDTSKKPVYHPC